MSSFCEKCGRWFFSPKDPETHRCLPEWEARIKDFHGDGEDDWEIVTNAVDAEDAAEKLAGRCDDESSLLECSEGWLVEVRKPGDSSSIQKFQVHAEACIEYTAHEVEEKTESEGV